MEHVDTVSRGCHCTFSQMQCVHAGFLYVSDSGIPQELIDANFEANKRYFQLPDEEKVTCMFLVINGMRSLDALACSV